MRPHYPENSREFYFEVARDHLGEFSFINKFGKNNAVSTSIAPVAANGIYQTPTAATTLRIKSGGNANDTAAGTGAQSVTLVGLDENWEEVTEEIETAGASASSATTTTFIRLYRAYVSRSGSYATQSAGSHSGTITVENSSGTADWAIIDASEFPLGQSQIACFTVPAGYRGYLIDSHFSVQTNKAVTIYGFFRAAANDVSTPYTGIMRIFDEFKEPEGIFDVDYETPRIFDGPCDIGYMASVSSGTASVSIHFHLVLEKL